MNCLWNYYYLFAADTGTGEGHGQSILRSRNIWGVYELYEPEENKKIRTSEREAYSMMTARHNPDFLLQKSGHGDLVEAENGEWYMLHLCGRTLEQRNPPDAVRFPGERRYMLGRETAIQKVTWTNNGWLNLVNGSTLPDVAVEIPEMGWQQEQADAESVARLDYAAVETQTGRHVWRDDFDEKTLSLEYQSLRVPMDNQHLSLTVRPGWLRMYGRDGLASKFSQSLIARRLTEFVVEVETKLEFEPTVFKQMAGLICMYDTENYFYLHVTHDEEIGKCISILTAENKRYEYPSLG